MIMTTVLDNVHCLGAFKHNVSKQTQFLKAPWQWWTVSRISHIHCNTSSKTFIPLAYIHNVTLLGKDINNTKKQRKALLAISKDVSLSRNIEKSIGKHWEKPCSCLVTRMQDEITTYVRYLTIL
jgi:hypothetical protein